MRRHAILAIAFAFPGGVSVGLAAETCPVTQGQLAKVLKESVKASGGPTNGGFDNHEWATVVNREGVVCAVAFSSGKWDEQWPGSRMISAAKAGTANSFSVANKAMATANLFAPAQPGQSLSGIVQSNQPPAELKNEDVSKFGTASDPMIGKRIGGVVVFGGGRALYDDRGIVGGLGVSGDSSCADHNVAWRVRKALGLDKVPAGPNPTKKDAIVYDIGPDGKSASGFGHVKCAGTEAEVATELGAGIVLSALSPRENLVQRQENPGEWVMPGRNYSGLDSVRWSRSRPPTPPICNRSGRSRPGCCEATKDSRW